MTTTTRSRRPPRGFDVALAARRSPPWFVENVLGSFPWSKQRELLESVRDHQRTAVRSCHGVGKTKGAAFAALWFLYTHPDSRVITTAPTWTQVKQLLWREIRAEHVKSGALDGRPASTELELGPDWFALGLSTDEPERFQGHHSDHILVIADEASGVHQDIFDAAEGYLTEWEGARMLLIGNPTQTSGQFYNAFHTERALWNRIAISAFDSPNFTDEQVPPEVARRLVSKAWVADKETKWGVGSILWDVRVTGQFAKQADDAVVSLAAVEQAQANVIPDELIHPDDVSRIVCDVARFGSDETVIYHRQGKRVRQLKVYVGKSTTETVGNLIAAKRETGASEVVVDDVGVGGGVTDQLREQGHSVVAFNGGETAVDEDTYVNARTEIWCDLADLLPQLDIPDDDQLGADLLAPIYKFDSKARKVLEPKDKTKKRIGRSPDRGDTLAMCFAPARHGRIEVW